MLSAGIVSIAALLFLVQCTPNNEQTLNAGKPSAGTNVCPRAPSDNNCRVESCDETTRVAKYRCSIPVVEGGDPNGDYEASFTLPACEQGKLRLDGRKGVVCECSDNQECCENCDEPGYDCGKSICKTPAKNGLLGRCGCNWYETLCFVACGAGCNTKGGLPCQEACNHECCC